VVCLDTTQEHLEEFESDYVRTSRHFFVKADVVWLDSVSISESYFIPGRFERFCRCLEWC